LSDPNVSVGAIATGVATLGVSSLVTAHCFGRIVSDVYSETPKKTVVGSFAARLLAQRRKDAPVLVKKSTM